MTKFTENTFSFEGSEKRSTHLNITHPQRLLDLCKNIQKNNPSNLREEFNFSSFDENRIKFINDTQESIENNELIPLLTSERLLQKAKPYVKSEKELKKELQEFLVRNQLDEEAYKARKERLRQEIGDTDQKIHDLSEKIHQEENLLSHEQEEKNTKEKNIQTNELSMSILRRGREKFCQNIQEDLKKALEASNQHFTRIVEEEATIQNEIFKYENDLNEINREFPLKDEKRKQLKDKIFDLNKIIDKKIKLDLLKEKKNQLKKQLSDFKEKNYDYLDLTKKIEKLEQKINKKEERLYSLADKPFWTPKGCEKWWQATRFIYRGKSLALGNNQIFEGRVESIGYTPSRGYWDSGWRVESSGFPAYNNSDSPPITSVFPDYYDYGNEKSERYQNDAHGELSVLYTATLTGRGRRGYYVPVKFYTTNYYTPWYRESIRDLEAEYELIKSNLRRLLDQKKQPLEDIKTQIDRLERSFSCSLSTDQLAEKQKKLNEEKRENDEALATLKEKKQSLESLIIERRQGLEELKKTREDLQKENAILVSRIEDLTQSLKDNPEYKSLDDQILEHENAQKVLSHDVGETYENINKLETKITELKEKLSQTETERGRLSTALSELDETYKKAAADYDQQCEAYVEELEKVENSLNSREFKELKEGLRQRIAEEASYIEPIYNIFEPLSIDGVNVIIDKLISLWRERKAREHNIQSIERFVRKWEGIPSEDDAYRIAVEESRREFNEKQQQDLKERALQYNLELVDVPGDGNCFFHALLHQLQVRGYLQLLSEKLNIENPTHLDLRSYAVDSLIRGIQSGRISGDILNENYIIEMATEGNWADGIIIPVMANALGITIVLINSAGDSPTTLVREGDSGIVYLGYQVGVHFQSVTGEPNEEIIPSIPLEQVVTNNLPSEEACQFNDLSNKVENTLIISSIDSNEEKSSFRSSSNFFGAHQSGSRSDDKNDRHIERSYS